MACSGGVESLDDSTAARLALFAALHDIGKVNVGFQTQIWRDEDLPAGRRRPGHAGHYNELAPVMRNEDDSTAGWFFENLGWWWGATESWDDCGARPYVPCLSPRFRTTGSHRSWKAVSTPILCSGTATAASFLRRSWVGGQRPRLASWGTDRIEAQTAGIQARGRSGLPRPDPGGPRHKPAGVGNTETIANRKGRDRPHDHTA